jgi:hypothetical protein
MAVTHGSRWMMRVLAGFAAVWTAAAAPAAQTPPPATQAPPAPATVPPAQPAAAPTAPAEEPGATAGGALRFFMASRDYRTIRELKSIMTTSLKATYDHDPTPFNGKKGFRLSAFDYAEPAPKPRAASFVVAVKDLWDDQGEAIEMRAENVRLVREGDGLWRVAALEKTDTEPLRYRESIAGVTSLRMVLRAWMRRDLGAARPLLSDAFLKKYAGREEALEALFAGDPALQRAAFRILEMVPDGTTRVVARVRLIETPPDRPAGLDGTPREIVFVKKGQRWILDDWK